MSKISRDKKKKAASKTEAAPVAAPAVSKLTCQLCRHWKKSEPCGKTGQHVARKQPACKAFKRKGES